MEQFQNGCTKIPEILYKILVDLKIGSVLSVANYLDNLHKIIVAEKDVARKALSFMDAIQKISQKD